VCGKNAEQDKEYKIPYDEYYLPDNETITVPGSIRIGAPEVMFQPNLSHPQGYCKSLDAMAWASV